MATGTARTRDSKISIRKMCKEMNSVCGTFEWEIGHPPKMNRVRN